MDDEHRSTSEDEIEAVLADVVRKTMSGLAQGVKIHISFIEQSLPQAGGMPGLIRLHFVMAMDDGRILTEHKIFLKIGETATISGLRFMDGRAQSNIIQVEGG
jgi:hypothetical protein